MSAIRTLIIIGLMLVGWIINLSLVALCAYTFYWGLLLFEVTKSQIPISDFLQLGFVSGVIAFSIELLLALSTDHKKLMEWGFGAPCIDVSAQEGFPQVVFKWVSEGKLPKPSIYLIMSDYPYGFTLNSSGSRRMYVSKGMFNALNTPHKMAWYIHNQLYYLTSRYGFGNHLWLAVNIVRLRAKEMFYRALKNALKGLGDAFAIGWFFGIVFHFVAFWQLLFTRGTAISTGVFQIIDAVFNSQDIYKADQRACELTGSQNGIDLFCSINKAIEPDWQNFFCKYPDAKKRIRRMSAKRNT